MDHELVVLSPEKSVLTYRLAGVGSRISAHILDLMIVGLLDGLAIAAIGALLAFTVGSPGYIQGIITVVAVTLPFLYFILLEGLNNGQTVGKMAFGLRVRMIDGTPVTFSAAVGRTLLRFADILPGTYLIGLVAMLTSERSQRIGDMVSSTVVIIDKRKNIPVIVKPYELGVHQLEASVGSLKGMTIDDYVALRKLADRFPYFEPQVQSNLIKEVWEPIRLKLNVPQAPNIHDIYFVEATVMKYGREKGLL